MKAWFNYNICIKFKTIAIMAYAVLVVPILVFFFGWLKWYFAVLFAVLLLVGMFKVYKNDYSYRKEKIIIPFRVLLFAGLLFAFWVLITGNCGVSVSNYDTPWRRALLRDLIDFKWPVYYEKTSTNLVYYHVFWMIPALIGKIFGWHAALVAQAIWLWLIIMISFLLISFILHAENKSVFILIAIMIVGWSGLNALGWILMQEVGLSPGNFGLQLNENYCDALFNGESFNFYYRSNEDFLCENFNQLLIWIVVPLMLENRKIRNYAFIGILLLPYSPWGVLGIAIMMIIDAIDQSIKYIKQKQLKELLLDIFSVPNICILASIGIVFGFYFSSGTRLSNEGVSFGILTLSKFDAPRIIGLIVFWLCEFGIYYLFLWGKNKNDKLFKLCLPVLMIIPICWAGTIWGRDFCMNVSLPILYMLMIYVIRYVKDYVINKVISLKNFALILCLVIAATTPIFDWGNKVQTMVEQKSIAITDDRYYTFSNKSMVDEPTFANFLSDNLGLFRYIARR